MSNEDSILKLILAIEGATRALLEIRDEITRINDEGVVVVAAPSSTEN